MMKRLADFTMAYIDCLWWKQLVTQVKN